MLDQEPSHHIETLLVSCLSLATRPCILNTAQFCTMASPYNEAAKYLLHGGGVLNAMLSLWSPDVPNLAAFTYLGVPEDWGVPGHRMFPLWRILCLPRHFVAGGDVFMAANPGRSRSCPPRNFGDTDWQRLTLTAGTGFGSRVILNKYVWVLVHEEMHLLREQVRGAVPTRYFGKNTANSSLSTSKLIKTIGRCSL